MQGLADDVMKRETVAALLFLLPALLALVGPATGKCFSSRHVPLFRCIIACYTYIMSS